MININRKCTLNAIKKNAIKKWLVSVQFRKNFKGLPFCGRNFAMGGPTDMNVGVF